MTARLASHVEVSGLIRRIETRGGTGVVVVKGDREAGGILVILADRGAPAMILERLLDVSGSYRWQLITPQDIEGYQEFNNYIQRRRRFDSDLWVVELDVAGVEQFAAEMIATG
jgi:hypothetical protein